MSALLESLARGFCGNDARRVELDAALQAGLPGPRAEAWKYTSLRQLERRSFQPAPLVPTLIDAALLDEIPSPRLVFVNGRPSDALSDLSTLPDGVRLDTLSASLAAGDEAQQLLGRRFEGSDEIFARLNAALADEGVLVRVQEGAQIEAPLHLVFIGVAGEHDLSWHHRHLIELRAGAALNVVEHHLHVGDAAHLHNSLMHVHLAQDAVLSHARVQADSAHATSLLRTDAVLARNARYQRVDLELGANLSRHELNVRLRATMPSSPPMACCSATAAAMSIHVWALRTSHATPPASWSGAAWAPIAAGWSSTAASTSVRAPMAPTRGCRTRICCCRPMPRSTPSRCW